MSKIRSCNSLSLIQSAGQSNNKLASQPCRNNILKGSQEHHGADSKTVFSDWRRMVAFCSLPACNWKATSFCSPTARQQLPHVHNVTAFRALYSLIYVIKVVVHYVINTRLESFVQCVFLSLCYKFDCFIDFQKLFWRGSANQVITAVESAHYYYGVRIVLREQ